MLIIGELINSSRRAIAEAISKRNADFLIEKASLQAESGADFIDINCAVRLKEEKGDLIWLIETIQNNLGIPISIDSPNPDVIDAALKIHKGKAFVNSITAESRKFKQMAKILKGKDVFIIALAMDDNGIPNTSQERVKLAKGLMDSLKKAAVCADNVYIDPLVKPVSSEPHQVKIFLEAVGMLKVEGIKTIGGLSNVSYGLPARRILNAVFLSLAIQAGIDAVILDPADRLIQGVIKGSIKGSDPGSCIRLLGSDPYTLAKQVLLGEDEYCANYIGAFREGKLNG